MEFTLNGERRAFIASPDLNVLTYLREVAGLISPKDGCSGEGVCGCCTVLVDGMARLSCRMKMKDLEGKSLTTAEGLSAQERDVFADAFVVKGGVQCGFCTPGIVMKAKAMLDKNPSPTRDEIAGVALWEHLPMHGLQEGHRLHRVRGRRTAGGQGRGRAPGHGPRGHAAWEVHRPGGRSGRPGLRGRHEGTRHALRGAALLGPPEGQGAPDRRLGGPRCPG